MLCQGEKLTNNSRNARFSRAFSHPCVMARTLERYMLHVGYYAHLLLSYLFLLVRSASHCVYGRLA